MEDQPQEGRMSCISLYSSHCCRTQSHGEWPILYLWDSLAVSSQGSIRLLLSTSRDILVTLLCYIHFICTTGVIISTWLVIDTSYWQFHKHHPASSLQLWQNVDNFILQIRKTHFWNTRLGFTNCLCAYVVKSTCRCFWLMYILVYKETDVYVCVFVCIHCSIG